MTTNTKYKQMCIRDRGIVSADKDALTLGDTSAVTEDFTLPTTGVNGSTITWTSNNLSLIHIL